MIESRLHRRLLRELHRDARQSNRDLARAIGVSPGTVINYIQMLRKKEVLKKFTVELDYEELGFPYGACSRMKTRSGATHEVLDQLKNYPYLIGIYDVTGDFDLLVVGLYHDQQHMNQTLKDLQGQPFVEGTNTSVILNVYRNRQYPIFTPEWVKTGDLRES